jgi:hypothetical protein
MNPDFRTDNSRYLIDYATQSKIERMQALNKKLSKNEKTMLERQNRDLNRWQTIQHQEQIQQAVILNRRQKYLIG